MGNHLHGNQLHTISNSLSVVITIRILAIITTINIILIIVNSVDLLFRRTSPWAVTRDDLLISREHVKGH